MQSRLITVTRQDLSAGYQTVQTAHAVADYAVKKPLSFLKWRLTGNYLISLAVADYQSLRDLMTVLDKHVVKYVPFYEPDVKEVTAIVISPGPLSDKLTSSLPLAGRKAGNKDKHN